MIFIDVIPGVLGFTFYIFMRFRGLQAPIDKEGDQGNAAYWHSRAGKPVCREALDEEWLSIVRELLG